ncbi:MAG: Tm-1-like ATP-binding domain-containing protein [Isosphaeraceae bacterium]
MARIALIGTLDTKGRELAFARDLARAQRVETLVIDAGSLGSATCEAEVSREEVFRRAGTSLEAIRERGERGEAVALAAEGVALIVAELSEKAQIDGVFALGGSAGTTIGTTAMRRLPFGMPKVMLSTLASGQTRPYVGGSDIVMVNSVADLAGLNRVTETVISNAVFALLGMIAGPRPNFSNKPTVAASMFGVTTPCVNRARELVEAELYEVVVFHATGIGGESMEAFIRDGGISGVLDLTTTELADEIVGGLLSAGPDRLRAAGRLGIPQVVSVGALDMANFGPIDTVPERFKGRNLVVHNANVTLLRTNPAENAAIAARMVDALSQTHGPTVLLIPTRGVSALDAPGKPFYDPEADRALFDGLERGLAGHPVVRVIRLDAHINDPDFADLAARLLLDMTGRACFPNLIEF